MVGVGILAIILLAAPIVLTDSFQQNLLALTMIYGVGAVGLYVVMGTMGQFSFGHAAFWGIGAYASGRFAIALGVTPWLGLVVGTLTATLLGWFVAVVALQRTRGLELAIVTLGFGVITWIMSLKWEWFGGGLSGISGVPSLSLFGISIQSAFRYYYLALGFVIVVVLAVAWIEKSRFGRGVRSVRENESMAASIGVAPRRHFILAFTLSAGITGLSGALGAHYLRLLSPSFFSLSTMITLLIMVLLGGTTTIWGPVLGSAMYIWFTDFFGFNQELRLFFFGLLVIALLRLMPKGAGHALSRAAERLMEWWMSRYAPDAPAPATVAPVTTLGRSAGPDRREDGDHTDMWTTGVSATPANGDILLRTESLTRAFGGLMAVNDLSFELRENEILGLIGPNGSGKTTTINMISGFLQPTGGRIFFLGEEITDLEPHEIAQMGLIRTFQLSSVFEGLTVEENVVHASHLAFSRQSHRPSPLSFVAERSDGTRVRARANELLDLVGLYGRRESQASELSAGELRFLEIAMALAAQPQALLLDEPVTGLNLEEADRFIDLIRNIRALGVSVLVVEHNMKVIMRLCDRIIVLNFGGLLSEGRPNEISRDEQVISAYLGRSAKAL